VKKKNKDLQMIRKLTIKDYSDVVKLWEKAGLEIRLNGRDHPDKMKKQLTSGNTVLLGKFQNVNLLGVVLVTHDGRKGWMNRLAVNPEFLRKGVAKELITRAETVLYEEFGIEVYSVLVLKENKRSDQFFTSMGYDKWEEVVYFSKRIDIDS
jgi:ribosomal protein S18 acetylase RimI-like enzyme